MLLKITRNKQTKNATLGNFVLFDDKNTQILSGYTLEPSGEETIKANLNRPILQGSYECIWRYSPKFKTKLPLLFNENVPKSRHILIHAGNYSQDTQGCILVGEQIQNGCLLNSSYQLAELRKALKERKFIVEIESKI